MKTTLAKVSQLLLIFTLASIFIGLGKWQFDRAAQWRELKAEEKVRDPQLYSLSQVAKPQDTLTNKQTYKRVATQGHYIATFKAPGQRDAKGIRADWEVSLLQIGTRDGILVVRGLWSDRLREPQVTMAPLIDVVGTLQPRQSEDTSLYQEGALQRLDSALVAGIAPDLNIYDGFIAATSEKFSGGAIERTRVTPPFRSAVTGYYWQHISYVVIWWLMAALTLYLPFYNRRISRTVQP